MAFDLGSVITHFKADVTGLKAGIDTAKEEVGGFKKSMDKVGESLSAFTKQTQIFAAVAGAGLTLFFNSASQEAANFEKALTTLDIISGRFGVSADKAKTAAKNLGVELRIGTGAAAESLQNLFKSGLNLDQATELLKRFTNEAITGKSPSITLAQAVQNLSFAYATNNSALGNLSGINENFSDIVDKGRAALEKEGKAAKDITDDMAKFRGMMDLTNLTLGSSERFVGSYIDKQAMFEQKMLEVKIAVGNSVNSIKSVFLDMFSALGAAEGVISFTNTYGPQIVSFFQTLGEWVKNNKELVITFLQGLGVALGAFLIIGTITTLLNPLALVAVAIGALFTAWQTNFLGIQQITQTVATWLSWLFDNYIKPIFMVFANYLLNEWGPAFIGFWNEVIIPAFNAFVGWFKERWDHISSIIKGAWEMIQGIIKLGWAIISNLFVLQLQILTGNWSGAWETIKKAGREAWEAVKQIFGGAIEFIKGWGGMVVHELVKPFQEAWDKIKDLVNKIADKMDFTKRHSPSIVDRIKLGVREANKAFEHLDFNFAASPQFATAGVNSSTTANSNYNQITISLDGAIVSDNLGAARIAERIGDTIINRLKTNVRF